MFHSTGGNIKVSSDKATSFGTCLSCKNGGGGGGGSGGGGDDDDDDDDYDDNLMII